MVENITKLDKGIISIMLLLLLCASVSASTEDNILKLHGYAQDDVGNFLIGIYEFNFTLFGDSPSTVVFSHIVNITTGDLGEWTYALNISGYDSNLFENGTKILLNISIDASATVNASSFGYVPYAYYCKYPDDEFMTKWSGAQRVGSLYYEILDDILSILSNATIVKATQMNFTSVKYNGSCTYGVYTGYTACDMLCDNYSAGSYVCSAEDLNSIRRYHNNNVSSISNWTDNQEAWINDWGQKYSPASVPMNDCNGHKWGVAGSYLGSWWRFNTTTGGDPKAGHCGNEFYLACCS